MSTISQSTDTAHNVRPTLRIPFPAAVTLILGHTIAEGLPDPTGYRDDQDDHDILGVNFATFDDLRAWAPFFGASVDQPRPSTNGQRLFIVSSASDWHGWYVILHAQEPNPDAPTVGDAVDAHAAEAIAASAIPVTAGTVDEIAAKIGGGAA